MFDSMKKKSFVFPGGIEVLIAALACIVATEQSSIPKVYSILMISALAMIGIYFFVKRMNVANQQTKD